MTGDRKEEDRKDAEDLQELQKGRRDVTKEVDCRVFEDQLDALMDGTLPEAGMRQLRLHADGCPDCAMQLKVQEHLTLPSLEELEGNVPQEMLTSMWSGVSAELAGRTEDLARRAAAEHRANEPGARAGFREGRASGWLVPTLAAATVALLFSTGFLVSERSRLKEREEILAQQVFEQKEWLAELSSGATSDPVVRTAALAGRNPLARALSRRETVSFAGLRSMLRALPDDRVLLEAAEIRAIRENPSALELPLWQEVLAGLDTRRAITAGELLRVLETLDVNPQMTVNTSDLIELLS